MNLGLRNLSILWNRRFVVAILFWAFYRTSLINCWLYLINSQSLLLMYLINYWYYNKIQPKGSYSPKHGSTPPFDSYKRFILNKRKPLWEVLEVSTIASSKTNLLPPKSCSWPLGPLVNNHPKTQLFTLARLLNPSVL